ncbi:urease subunit beta [Actinoplanes sp. CA-054009]
MIPGEILHGDGDIEINSGRTPMALTVRNTGDRPVQVGSHFHFAESNEALDFDRTAAWGHRLAVPAGTSVRFEPGMPRDVTLIPLAGARIVPGLRGLAAGPLDAPPAASSTSSPATGSPATGSPATGSPATGSPAAGSPALGPHGGAGSHGGAAPSPAPPHPPTFSDISDLSPSSGEPENGSSR